MANSKITDLTPKVTGDADDEFIINDVTNGNVDKKLGMDGIRITESQVTDLQSYITDVTGSALLDARFWIGDGTNQAVELAISGDATVANTGALTISSKAVEISMLADGTDGELITWDASGVAATVAAGTSGQVLTSNGAGAAPTFQAAAGGGALDDLSDVTITTVATGDLFYKSAGDWINLAIGTNGQVLKVNAGIPSWQAEGGGTTHDLLSATHTDVLASAVSQGSIIYGNGTPAWAELAVGTAGQRLEADGTDVAWSSTITNQTANDFTNTIAADETHIQVRNSSGATINKGDAVYISGFDVGNSLPTVALADSNGAGTMPAIGLVKDTSIANNANGGVIVSGRLDGLDTSSYSATDALFVSDVGTTGNTLTTTRPTGTTDGIQKIGIVLRSHVSLGVIELIGAGRTNDVPNLQDARLWIGNGTNVATAVTMSGDVTITNAGVTTVADDSHAHTSSTITLASTDLSDTANLARNSDNLSFFSATTSAQLAGVISDETGSGSLVFATSPTLVTPALDTPASGVLTNCTGLPTGGMVDNAVTFAKMQDITSDRILGRDTAASGDPEELTLNSTLEFTGSGGIQRAAITGDVSVPAGSNTATISNLAVTKLENDARTANIQLIIDGGGSAITTGIKGDIQIDFPCTIQQVTMLADQTGSIVVDIWKDTYANFPATDADSITASAVPTISASNKSQDSTLTGWTTSIADGDHLRFNVDSASSVERVTISLEVLKT